MSFRPLCRILRPSFWWSCYYQKSVNAIKSFSKYWNWCILMKFVNNNVTEDWLYYQTFMQVLGAYFEKTGSKSFAVYSIAVTDTDNKTWFVKRRYVSVLDFHLLFHCLQIAFYAVNFPICRYRNFERLHRHLKEIPNYSLHLPPKRFLSSSIDDQFVHQRCVLLDKYLQVINWNCITSCFLLFWHAML